MDVPLESLSLRTELTLIARQKMALSQRAQILGSGIALPEKQILSSEIDHLQGLKTGETCRRTGVYSRHHATNESAAQLAKTAVEYALQNSAVRLTEVDCLIAASGTPEQAIPFNAAKMHSLIGFDSPVPAFDINMTCLSALKAMEIGSIMLTSGQYNRVLIVSSDIASAGVNWRCRETAGLFGDGAAAIVLARSESNTAGFTCFNFETHSSGVELCQIRGGGSLNPPSAEKGNYEPYAKFEMKGRELYRLTFQVIDDFIDRTLDKAGLTRTQIDWVVPHQASALAISHLRNKLGFASERVISILKNRGNQIAVSLPSAYHELMKSNVVKTGEKILFIGTSAGLGLGAAVLTL